MTTLTSPSSEDRVMDLLRSGVPLSLLLDLVDPTGPHSDEILVVESRTAA